MVEIYHEIDEKPREFHPGHGFYGVFIRDGNIFCVFAEHIIEHCHGLGIGQGFGAGDGQGLVVIFSGFIFS